MLFPFMFRSLLTSSLIALATLTPTSWAAELSPVAPNSSATVTKSAVTAPETTLSAPAENQLASDNSTAISPEPALTVAMIMPPDESDVLQAARIVSNGLIAASQTHDPAIRVLLIEAPTSVPLIDEINAATLAGADIVVGPIERSRIEELSKVAHLPIPVLALNILPRSQSIPPELTMMGLSTDMEAKIIAEQAIKQGMLDTDTPLQVAILTTPGSWEEKLVAGYVEALQQARVNYKVFTIEQDRLNELRESLEPSLSPEDIQTFNEARKAILADTTLTDKARQKQLKTLDDNRRTQKATATPPYPVVLLATDQRTASLVRNLLPLRSSVWGTSTINPGDPNSNSMAVTLSYDLNGVNFTESPLLVKYDEARFEKTFNTPMPYSSPAKRLFALGVDALQVAYQIAKGDQRFEWRGETGTLSYNKSQSNVVVRTPDLIHIVDGKLLDLSLTPEEKAAMQNDVQSPSNAPTTPANVDLEALPKTEKTLETEEPTSIKPVIVNP